MTDRHGAMPEPWWGEFEVPERAVLHWRIGPLKLWIQRLPREWRVAHQEGDDWLDSVVQVARPEPDLDLLQMSSVVRFSMAQVGQTVCLRPLLADRPVVSRPDKPFMILPGEQIVVYVTTPLWVRVQLGEPPRQLTEGPTWRPSDTWFGADTRSGELCYASRTVCRTQLAELSVRPHRATTAVTLLNRASTPLQLQRLKLPVEYLSIFLGPDGRLWTEDVLLRRGDEQGYAQLELKDRSVRRAPRGATLLSAPRKQLGENLMVRVFGELFG